MANICFYFQVHQPFRLRRYTYFDIGNSHEYFDEAENKRILERVSQKCYLPTNKLLLDLIKKYDGRFKISFSITGTAIEQFKKYQPEVLASFKALAETNCVEFIDETYYHSLAFLYSPKDFAEQVQKHRELMQKEFGVHPSTFRNTELIYRNDLAHLIEKLGYKTILMEGADKILGWQSPNFVYAAQGTKNLKLLLKNYRLSDDMAFRFSEHNWSEFPLTAEKFAYWINTQPNTHSINLFLDYETFGEHQWPETGIFEFLKALPKYLFLDSQSRFFTPREVSTKFAPVNTLDVPYFVSWADAERDLTAWNGNALQQDALKCVYEIEQKVKETKDEKLIDIWRKLQTSDHFYYMCTKFAGDGTVHSYFNPYDNPYEAYVNFQNIMTDFKELINFT